MSVGVSASCSCRPLPGFAQSNADVAAGTATGPPLRHRRPGLRSIAMAGPILRSRTSRSSTATALRTADGRLEVILPDGSLLHVDRATTVDMLAADLFRLLQGRVSLIVRGARRSAASGPLPDRRACRVGADGRAGRVPRVVGRERARPRGGTGGVQRAGHPRERGRDRGGAGRRTIGRARRARAECAAVFQLRPLGRVRPLERRAARRTPRHRVGAVPARRS